MRCKGMKKGLVRHKGAISPGSERLKNCGRPAAIFFRVHYSELFTYADNGVYEDVIGFCEECAADKDKPSGYDRQIGTRYWSDRKVLHLRGHISRVESHDGSGVDGELHNKRMHDGKRELLKIMSYKGNADLADDWEEIFEMALKEFQVKAVMGA